jgi:hypothetical protein
MDENEQQHEYYIHRRPLNLFDRVEMIDQLLTKGMEYLNEEEEEEKTQRRRRGKNVNVYNSWRLKYRNRTIISNSRLRLRLLFNTSLTSFLFLALNDSSNLAIIEVHRSFSRWFIYMFTLVPSIGCHFFFFFFFFCVLHVFEVAENFLVGLATLT